MAMLQFSPLPKQREFLNSKARQLLFAGGYGSGKTAVLCRKIIQLMDYNRGIPGAILCPTYTMFSRDVYPMFRDMLLQAGLQERKHYGFNRSLKEYFFPQTASVIYVFHGKDHGASIRGPNLGWLAINEVTLCSKDTYDAALARVRLKDAKLPQVAMVGTWEGFQWTYELLVSKAPPNSKTITASTRENIHLDPKYVQTLESTYDELMCRQYIDGIPTNMAGNLAAWSFDRSKHLKEVEPRFDLPVLVSVDFNVNPMSATFWNLYQREPVVVLKAFFELSLKNSNTFHLVKTIRDYLQGSAHQVIIYPDPAGSNRQTSAMMTDIQIFREAGFLDIRFKKRIYSVKENLNAMNALLAKHQVEIDPKCVNLIKDLERCALLDDLTIDKSDQERSHWIDGFKNMADFEWPIIRPKPITVTRYA